MFLPLNFFTFQFSHQSYFVETVLSARSAQKPDACCEKNPGAYVVSRHSAWVNDTISWGLGNPSPAFCTVIPIAVNSVFGAKRTSIAQKNYVGNVRHWLRLEKIEHETVAQDLLDQALFFNSLWLLCTWNMIPNDSTTQSLDQWSMCFFSACSNSMF